MAILLSLLFGSGTEVVRGGGSPAFR